MSDSISNDDIQNFQRSQVEAILNQVLDNFGVTFNLEQLKSEANKFERYFSYPNANTAINPLNMENPSNSPLPTPADSRAGQSQVNRLAAVEEISRTAIARRDNNREFNIPIAHSNATWTEPAAAFSPMYPHNHVRASARGIVEEMDDTPNATRYHLYHPSGSFLEIDNNGTRINKVVADNYEIIAQNNSVHIKGRCNITIEGDCNLKVMNSAYIDVDGSANILVKNDVEVIANGKAFVNAKEEIALKSDRIILEARQLDLNIEEAINMKSKSFSSFTEDAFAVTTKTATISSDQLALKGEKIDAQGGIFSFNTTNVDFNEATLNGGPANAEKLIDTKGDILVKFAFHTTGPKGSSKLDIPDQPEVRKTDRILPQGSRAYPSQPEFPDNPRIDRFLAYAMNNDEPNNGTLVFDSNSHMGVPSSGFGEEDMPVSKGSARSDNVDVSDIINTSNIPLTTVLSRHCSLADVTINPAVSHCHLRPQAGLTEGEIAANLKFLCVNVIDKLFDRYGKGNVLITSAFRYPGSNPTSQHPLGQAVDVQFRDIPKSQYAARAAEIAGWLDYDQLLFEYSSNGQTYSPWVHISTSRRGNRNQYATINTANNRFLAGKIINPFAAAPVMVAKADTPTDGSIVRPASDVTNLT